ncbi:hypothetical protein EZS27_021330 [termite gut metagenome]|uniref:Uncharacterized protein n=1 Tax=termite gut metagenome TaxID=433724 RepID=A0A5J4RB10_9ZZZZ
MNFIIDCQIFPFDIMVHFGKRKELYKELVRFHLLKNEINNIKNASFKNRSIMFSGGQTLLYMEKQPATLNDLAILQHEIFHCVCFILDRAGVKYSKKSDEVFAYFIQFITRKIYERIKVIS